MLQRQNNFTCKFSFIILQCFQTRHFGTQKLSEQNVQNINVTKFSSGWEHIFHLYDNDTERKMTEIRWIPRSSFISYKYARYLLFCHSFILTLFFLPLDNDLYIGTDADFSGNDPIIYREPLQTDQYDSLSLNGKTREATNDTSQR